MKIKKLSIVLPVYNEEENIQPLYELLSVVLNKCGRDFEILFVDDGSNDNSFEVLKDIQSSDNKVRLIKLRSNFGQSAAMDAGIRNSKGDIIVMMDADMQNDPRDIPKLLEKMESGYDMVSGWRYNRKDSFFKRFFSKIANSLHNKMTGVGVHDNGCSLKAYTKESLKDIHLFGEMHRYIPALVHMRGFRVGEVKVNHLPRKYGKTKYGSGRLIRGFLDLIFISFLLKYSARPLHFFGMLGIIPLLIGFAIGAFKTYDLFNSIIMNKEEIYVGPLLLFSVFMIITGILILMFGFIAEMNTRMFYSGSSATNYSIEKIIE